MTPFASQTDVEQTLVGGKVKTAVTSQEFTKGHKDLFFSNRRRGQQPQ